MSALDEHGTEPGVAEPTTLGEDRPRDVAPDAEAVPPGTPHGECLLRCSVSAAHTPEQIDDFWPLCIAGLALLGAHLLAAFVLRYTPW